MRSAEGLGTEGWALSGPDGGKCPIAVGGGLEAIKGEGAGANAGFDTDDNPRHTTPKSKPGGSPWQADLESHLGGNLLEGGSATNHDRARWVVVGSQILFPWGGGPDYNPREGILLTGSIDFNRRSQMGRLGTSGSLGFRTGGNAVVGRSSGVGHDEGRSISGMGSFGLSEADGVPAGFLWGRGPYFAGRDIRQGLGHSTGTVFSQGAGGSQVLKLCGLRPNRDPRAQPVVMASARAIAATGRGNLDYGLNPRKPIRCPPCDAGWGDVGPQVSQSRDERPACRLGIIDVGVIKGWTATYSQAEGENPPEAQRQIDLPGELEVSERYVEVEMRLGTETSTDTERPKAGRPIHSERQIDIEKQVGTDLETVVPPCPRTCGKGHAMAILSTLELDEAGRDMVATAPGRREAAFRVSLNAFDGRNDMWLHIPMLPAVPGVERPVEALASSSGVSVVSMPEFLLVEPEALGSMDAPRTSGSWSDDQDGPASDSGKSTPGGVNMAISQVNATGVSFSGGKCAVGHCDFPLDDPQADSAPWFYHALHLSTHEAAILLSTAKAEAHEGTPLEDARVSSSTCGLLVDQTHVAHATELAHSSRLLRTDVDGVVSAICASTNKEDTISPSSAMASGTCEDGQKQGGARVDSAIANCQGDTTDEIWRMGQVEVKSRKKFERDWEREENDKGKNGHPDKRQKFGNDDQKEIMPWIRLDSPEIEKPAMPLAQSGLGSFMKWMIHLGKGRSANHTSDIFIPSGPAEPSITTLWSMAGASFSQVALLPEQGTKDIADVAVVEVVEKEFLSQETVYGDIAASRWGSEIGVVSVLKSGKKGESREYEEVYGLIERQQAPILNSATHNQTSLPLNHGTYLEPQTRDGDNDAWVLGDFLSGSEMRELQRREEDSLIGNLPSPTLERTQHIEEYGLRSRDRRFCTVLDNSGQLEQQGMQSNRGTRQAVQKGAITKFSQHEDVAPTQRELGPALEGRLEVDQPKLPSFRDGNSIRNMWICRFAPKGVGRHVSSAHQQQEQEGLAPTTHRQVPLPALSSQAFQSELVSSKIKPAIIHDEVLGAEVTSNVESPTIQAANNVISSMEIDSGQHSCGTGVLHIGTTMSDGLHHASMYGRDFSCETPHGQGMADCVAAMRAVKTWRIDTAKFKEGLSQNVSTSERPHYCWFCGLPGHGLADCSETLDCELCELEARVGNMSKIRPWAGEMQCLRCLGVGHWGAQCHLSVTDAASRARGKAESQSLNKTRWICNEGESGKEKQRAVAGTQGVRDYSIQHIEGVVCYNCHETGHGERYCTWHLSNGVEGGCSSGYNSSGSIGRKRQPPCRVEKSEAYAQVTDFGKGSQEVTESRGYRRGQHPSDEGAFPLMQKNNNWKEPRQRSNLESSEMKGQRREVNLQLEVLGEKCEGQNSCLDLVIAVKVTGDNNACPSAGALTKSSTKMCDTVPPVPKGVLAAVELIRLSRPDLLKWVDSPNFGARVEGFFLRLRFGQWEAQLGGTGYRMARIKGAVKKSIGKLSTMSVSVDLGGRECTVDGQYVSNQAFTEAIHHVIAMAMVDIMSIAMGHHWRCHVHFLTRLPCGGHITVDRQAELAEWLRARYLKSGGVVFENELECKLYERLTWPSAL